MTRLFAWFIAAAAFVVVAGCSGPTASHYQAVLDEMNVPAGWELARETVKTPDGPNACASLLPGCPSVTRYYLVAGTPAAAYPAAKQLITEGGFTVDQEFDPACDAPPSAAACAIRASRGDEGLLVSLYNPGDDFDNIGVAVPDRSLVRIIAAQK